MPEQRAIPLEAVHAMAIYRAAVDAVRADTLVKKGVIRHDNVLQAGSHVFDLGGYRRVWVVGAGKASAPMAAVMDEILGDRLTGGLVVTKEGHAQPGGRVRGPGAV